MKQFKFFKSFCTTETVKRSEGKRDIRQSTEDFSGSETTLCDTTMANTWHYTFVKTHRCTTPRVNTNVN